MYAFSTRFPRFGATFIETQNGSDITPQFIIGPAHASIRNSEEQYASASVPPLCVWLGRRVAAVVEGPGNRSGEIAAGFQWHGSEHRRTAVCCFRRTASPDHGGRIRRRRPSRFCQHHTASWTR